MQGKTEALWKSVHQELQNEPPHDIAVWLPHNPFLASLWIAQGVHKYFFEITTFGSGNRHFWSHFWGFKNTTFSPKSSLKHHYYATFYSKITTFSPLSKKSKNHHFGATSGQFKIATFRQFLSQNHHFFTPFQETQKSPLFWWRIAPNFCHQTPLEKPHFGDKSPLVDALQPK